LIGLDTNVLVRFLVEDDPEQTRRAGAMMRAAIDKDVALFVADIVLCECAWVLDVSYGVPRKEVAENFALLLQARHLLFEDRDRLRRAVEAFRGGRGDFADYLISEVARAAGCSSVATFDRALLREDGFARPAASLP
jgi:predicted nucleic-acid-binding protein